MNAVPRPPGLAQFLVERLAPRTVREHLLGDLDEQFFANVSTFGIRVARRRYWRQAMATLWHWPLGSGPEPRPHAKNRESSMFSLLDDARFALRQLLRQPSYLGRLFRQEVGTTVRNYLTLVRLEHAAALIHDGVKIEAVALTVGYRSKKNFYEQFKRHFGTTPMLSVRHRAGTASREGQARQP